jgi:hypothetical protein
LEQVCNNTSAGMEQELELEEKIELSRYGAGLQDHPGVSWSRDVFMEGEDGAVKIYCRAGMQDHLGVRWSRDVFMEGEDVAVKIWSRYSM